MRQAVERDRRQDSGAEGADLVTLALRNASDPNPVPASGERQSFAARFEPNAIALRSFRRMEKLMAEVRRFSLWGLWLGGALVLLAAVLIGIDVLMRKFLARSIGGADELAGYALAIGTTWGLGAALLDREHIRIDSLYGLFPKKLRLFLDVVALLDRESTRLN